MLFSLPEVSTPIFALLAALWLIALAAGRYQLKKIKENTVGLVLNRAKERVKKEPGLNIHRFYESIYPAWRQMVKSNALFIPHKTELWPMPAYPEYVRDRIKFTPEVVGFFLLENGIVLNGVEIEASNEPLPVNQADCNKNRRSLPEQLCNLFAKYQKRY